MCCTRKGAMFRSAGCLGVVVAHISCQFIHYKPTLSTSCRWSCTSDEVCAYMYVCVRRVGMINSVQCNDKTVKCGPFSCFCVNRSCDDSLNNKYSISFRRSAAGSSNRLNSYCSDPHFKVNSRWLCTFMIWASPPSNVQLVNKPHSWFLNFWSIK